MNPTTVADGTGYRGSEPFQTFILVDEAWFGGEVAAGRRVIPFSERDGHYGDKPADDATAIRDTKQLAGRGACQCRVPQAMERHVPLVLLAFVVLQQARLTPSEAVGRSNVAST